MKDRRILLILAAAVLLVGAVVASRCSDEALDSRSPEAKALEQREKVVFPRDEAKRKRPRSTTPLDTQKAADAPAPPAKDKLVRAVGGDDGAIFAEVNAIRHSDLVEKMMKCREDEANGQLAMMKEELGIDPSEDVDRIGFDDEVMAATGFFENLKLPAELGEGEAYGDGARVWKLPAGENGEGPGYAARVGNDLMLVGEDEAAVRAAVDRAEGRGEPTKPIDEALAKSEIYGPLSKELIAGFLRNESDPLAQQLLDSVAGGTLRMNIDEHVKVSLDLEAKDAATGEDLAKAVGGAFAMMRKQAADSGDPELAWLLEQARVLPQEGGKFGLDLAVPGTFILDKMGCDPNGEPLPGRARTEGRKPAAP